MQAKPSTSFGGFGASSSSPFGASQVPFSETAAHFLACSKCARARDTFSCIHLPIQFQCTHLSLHPPPPGSTSLHRIFRSDRLSSQHVKVEVFVRHCCCAGCVRCDQLSSFRRPAVHPSVWLADLWGRSNPCLRRWQCLWGSIYPGLWWGVWCCLDACFWVHRLRHRYPMVPACSDMAQTGAVTNSIYADLQDVKRGPGAAFES